MAGIKISALPAIPSSALADVAPFVQGGVTYKASNSQLITLYNANLQLSSTAQVTGLPAALASFLPLAGGTMTGDISMGNNSITNVDTPVNPGDAVNKAYADAIGGGFTVILACRLATTANLNATQAGAGVGATLTNAGAMVALSIDGVATVVGDRILVKDQTLPEENGVYTVTDIGSGATNWILTRATDYDQPAEIQPGTLIAVNAGTVNANTSWLETATVVTVDTDPILFSQFTFAPSSFLLIANNLSELTGTAATARANIGLGTVATKAASDAAKTIAVMADAATTIGNIAVFTDTNGTIGDGGSSLLPLLNDFCDGRITLTSGLAVTTSNILAATTLYFTPYKGNQISLYDGSSAWETISFSEISIAVPATTSTMYDLFCYNNAGTATLETQAWTNDTTRAIGLILQDGVYVKTGVTTRRYLGSFRTTTVNGQTEDSAQKRYVFNYYNRSKRTMSAIDTTNTWAYSNIAYRQANANTANQLDFVIGVSEDAVNATVISMASNSAAAFNFVAVGVGLDSTTVNSAVNFVLGQCNSATGNAFPKAEYNAFITVGRHTLAWLERGAGANTQTWYGDFAGTMQSGIQGNIWA